MIKDSLALKDISPLRVAILAGGKSLLRNQSLASAEVARESLRSIGFYTETIEPDQHLVHNLERMKPDFVFITLQGRDGETGEIQSILETKGIDYVGSDSRVSSLCFDKHIFKTLILRDGLFTPAWQVFSKESFLSLGAGAILKNIVESFGLPLVVKPDQEGSAFGVRLVEREEDLVSSIVSAFSYSNKVIVEEYIKGVDLSVILTGSSRDPEVLPAVSIRKNDDEKQDGSPLKLGVGVVEEPPFSNGKLDSVYKSAKKAYSLAGARDMAKIDMVVQNDITYILEINTLPDLSLDSPAIFAAAKEGIGAEGLVQRAIARLWG